MVTVVYRLDDRLRYRVRYGAKLTLPVQKWPQKGLTTPTPPISTSSMPPLCADATQCFPERLRGWVGPASARGKGLAVACMETQKSNAVLDFWSITIIAERKEKLWAEIGAKRPNYCQNRTVWWHCPCTVGTVLFKQTVLAPRKYGTNCLEGQKSRKTA